jgi:hypothetical protein
MDGTESLDLPAVPTTLAARFIILQSVETVRDHRHIRSQSSSSVRCTGGQG